MKRPLQLALMILTACGAEEPRPDGTMQQGAAALCDAWQAGRIALSNGGEWSGNVSACTPGTLSNSGLNNTLTLVNAYRAVAQLEPSSYDTALNAEAQQCALMMHANRALAHNPPSSWRCYSASGSAAAGSSNIATAPSVPAVEAYMIDAGGNNAITLGHRRWILSESLPTLGIGSTDGYSCLRVIGTAPFAGERSWIAWPAAGDNPIDIVTSTDFNGENLDSSGWSIQSNQIDLTEASVRVELLPDSLDRPVSVRTLSPNFGSLWAIAFRPQGWRATAGQAYEITVSPTDPSKDFSYVVRFVSCT